MIIISLHNNKLIDSAVPICSYNTVIKTVAFCPYNYGNHLKDTIIHHFNNITIIVVRLKYSIIVRH